MNSLSNVKKDPFSITVRVDTEVRPYVGIFAVFLFWYQQTVSVDATNNSARTYRDITVHLQGMPETQGCDTIDETYVIPLLAPNDRETRVFRYKRQTNCQYLFSTDIISCR